MRAPRSHGGAKGEEMRRGTPVAQYWAQLGLSHPHRPRDASDAPLDWTGARRRGKLKSADRRGRANDARGLFGRRPGAKRGLGGGQRAGRARTRRRRRRGRPERRRVVQMPCARADAERRDASSGAATTGPTFDGPHLNQGCRSQKPGSSQGAFGPTSGGWRRAARDEGRSAELRRRLLREAEAGPEPCLPLAHRRAAADTVSRILGLPGFLRARPAPRTTPPQVRVRPARPRSGVAGGRETLGGATFATAPGIGRAAWRMSYQIPSPAHLGSVAIPARAPEPSPMGQKRRRVTAPGP